MPRIRKATRRIAGLRRMLVDRRRKLQDEVAERIRAGRAGRLNQSGDGLEATAADVEGDIGLSLIQMHSEMLARVEHAIERLDAGRFGMCAECGDEISEQRLSALPFAVRCQSCEETREQSQTDIRRRAQQKGSFWLFSDSAGS